MVFQSPCGELVMKALYSGASRDFDSLVSVPLRGIGYERVRLGRLT